MPVIVFALAWCALLFAQLVDFAAESVELRAASGPARSGRGRIVTWIAAAAAPVVVAVAAGAAVGVSLLAAGHIAGGLVLLTVLVFAVGAGAIAAVSGLLRPRAGGYPGVRAEIEQLAAQRVTKLDVASIRHSLAAVDAANARPRTPPWLRFVPATVGLAAVISVVVWLTTASAWPAWWWFAVVALLMPAASALIAIGTDRVTLRAREAWGGVYSAQRAAVETELDLLERRASRGVTGLTERVSKALGILRERDAKK